MYWLYLSTITTNHVGMLGGSSRKIIRHWRLSTVLAGVTFAGAFLFRRRHPSPGWRTQTRIHDMYA